MIFQKEITDLSESLGVAGSVVAKDWVLGHFLSAIYSEKELKANLVFKGGTCLRKCWYPDYRFSEDLDFTALSEEFVFHSNHLERICDHIFENADIRTSIVSLNPIQFKNKLVGYKGVVKYWGADHPKNEAPPPLERWHTKVKIEVILYERLLFSSVQRHIYHPYSDELAFKETIPCYAIEEVLSEKIRALVQRSYTAPRDYYDIWYLSNNVANLDWSVIVNAFHEKIKWKGLAFSGPDQLISHKNEKSVMVAWKNSLGHQINKEKMPPYDQVKQELSHLFRSIFKD